MKQFKYGGFIFQVFNQVYLPADDTFLLLENLNVNYGNIVLDLGTGCGILGMTAANTASKVVLTDISPIAIKCSKQNVRLNNLSHKIEVRQGNLFHPIKVSEKFDLILFNPPYLPISDEEKKHDWLEKAWDGGKNGRDIIDNFLEKFENFLKKDGRVQMVQTTLSNVQKTLDFLKKRNFFVEIQAEKKFLFEKILVLQVKKQ